MMRRRFVPALVFLVALFAYGQGARTQGNTRDEGYYFDAAEFHWGWFGELGDNTIAGKPWQSFTRKSVDRWYSYNHEHPPLMKTLFGISWRLFHRCDCPHQNGRHPVPYAKKHATLHLLGEEMAFRLPTIALSALMVLLVFLLGAELWSERAGLVASALTLFASRLFFDAQLACFDAPVAAMWMATVYAYHRALTEPRWRWRCGVVFGLALATKHNAFFLPPLFILHSLWTQRARLLSKKLPEIPPVFWWMALLSPAVYLASWPWMWFDTIKRFSEYVGFHVHHVYYNMEFLGVNYNKPPFPLSFPYLMTLFTIPATTLALALLGAIFIARRTHANIAFLLLSNAIFPLAIITLTRAPIFGATKHWHAAIPFIALLAGFAIHKLTDGKPRALVAALITFVIAAPAVDTWRSHPYGLSHYTMLAGGPMGGATMGLNRQFWGYATRGLLPYLNERITKHPRIYFHDTNQDQLDIYVRQGLLRPQAINSGMEEAGVRSSDTALVIHERHFNKYEYWIWDFFRTVTPARVLTHLGVPVVTVYERPAQ